MYREKGIIMARKKKRWRTRTSGTPSQVGQHFIIDDESMQSKKARLPPPSIWIRGNPLRRQSEEDKQDDERLKEKRKRLKKLARTYAEKKKHEKYMMGQPIHKEEPKEGLEKFDQEVREEAKELKDGLHDDGVYAVVEIKREFKPISEILRDNRFYRWLDRKTEGYRRKREESHSQT
jgi:hypothetical protein